MKNRLIAPGHCIACGFNLGVRDTKRSLFCFTCARQANKASHLASSLVKKAIRRGELKPPRSLKCVDCKSRADVYDHRSYERPLEIEPVCFGCNVRRGPVEEFRKFLPVGVIPT